MSVIASKYEEILRALPETILEVDDDMRLLYVSRDQSPVFTRTANVGDSLLDVVPVEAADAIVDAIDTAVRSGGSISEYRSQNVAYGLSARPLASSMGTLVIIESASQFNSGGSNVRQLLRDHQRFLSAARYDLANPLSAVVGCANVLLERDDTLDEETRIALVSHMSRESVRLTGTLEDMRTALSIELGDLELAAVEIDVIACVTEVMAAIGVGPDLISLDTSQRIVGFGDPVRFRQIVRNLLTNSMTHGQGKITLKTAIEGHKAVLYVRDPGDALTALGGRPGDTKPSTYPPTPRKVGLGLWLSKELAERMGGSLQFEHMGNDVKFRLAIATPTKHAAV